MSEFTKLIKMEYEKMKQAIAETKHDVNHTTAFGLTLLHYAAGSNWPDCVVKLLEMGANPNANSPLCGTPLHIAAKHNHSELVSIIMIASKHIIDLEAVDVKGNTPLFTAIAHKSHDTMKMLIEKGANIETRDKNEHTPLHAAAKIGNNEAIEVLVAHKAQIDARASGDATPFQVAVLNHHFCSANALLEAGADIDALVEKGSTMLHAMAAVKDVESVSYLIDHGANLFIKNADGHIPLDYATGYGRKLLAAACNSKRVKHLPPPSPERSSPKKVRRSSSLPNSV